MAITLSGLMNNPKEPHTVTLQFSESVPASLLEHLYQHLRGWCARGWPVYPDMTPLHCDKCEWIGFDPSEAVNECPECGCTELTFHITTAEPPELPHVQIVFKPDPVAEALRQAWHVAKDGALVPPDGGSPTEDEVALCNHIAEGIEKLIAGRPTGYMFNAN